MTALCRSIADGIVSALNDSEREWGLTFTAIAAHYPLVTLEQTDSLYVAVNWLDRSAELISAKTSQQEVKLYVHVRERLADITDEEHLAELSDLVDAIAEYFLGKRQATTALCYAWSTSIDDLAWYTNDQFDAVIEFSFRTH